MATCRCCLPGLEFLHFLANGFALLTEFANLGLILIDLLLFGAQFSDEIVLAEAKMRVKMGDIRPATFSRSRLVDSLLLNV